MRKRQENESAVRTGAPHVFYTVDVGPLIYKKVSTFSSVLDIELGRFFS